MFVKFQVFVSVICFFYQGIECIKQRDKSNMNFEERGERSIRSLIDLKGEEALENAKRVAEYFESNGPMKQVKLREPCEVNKCGHCSSGCESRQSNSLPPYQPPSEPKDSIVGARMENSWCPATMLGITHHPQSNNQQMPKNEIVGSPRQSLTTETYPKKIITQPNFKEPRLNIKTTVPVPFYTQQLQPNSRSFKNEDMFYVLPANAQQITIPLQQLVLSATPNQPIEPMDSMLPQQRTFFNLKYPQGGAPNPLGIPPNNFVVPHMWPPLLPTPFIGIGLLAPKLPLFLHKLPFKLFHKRPLSCPSHINIAMPRGLSTDNLSLASASELNPLVSLETPRIESNFLTNDLNPQMSYPTQMNIETPVVVPHETQERLLHSLGLGLKPYKFPLGLPLNDLSSYPVAVGSPSFEMAVPHKNLYNTPIRIQHNPAVYNAPLHLPGFHKLNGLPIFTKNPHCREAVPEFDSVDGLEDTDHQEHVEIVK